MNYKKISKILTIALFLFFSLSVVSVDGDELSDDILYFENIPEQIEEGALLEIRVTDGENGVQDVQVTFGWSEAFLLTTEDGWVSTTAIYVDYNRKYTIQASKQGYVSASEDIIIIDIEELGFIIEVQSSVEEGSEVEITIYYQDTGEIISDATVSCFGFLKQTDTNGKVYFTAPEVDEDTEYTIEVNKEGYQTATTTLTVVDTGGEPPPTLDRGWVFGRIVDSSDGAIADVQICIQETSDCVDSDNNGQYQLSVEPGTYTLEITKQGYQTVTEENIEVVENEGTERNIVLLFEEEEPEPNPDDLITNEQEEGEYGGHIIFQQVADDITVEEDVIDDISLFSSINTDEHQLLFTIDGTVDSGKVFFISIEKAIFPLVDDIVVSYDGVYINRADNATDAVNASDDGSLPEYYILTDSEDGKESYIVVLSIPHFSSHDIIVSFTEVVEELSNTPFMILYAVIIVIGAIVYIAPIYLYQRK